MNTIRAYVYKDARAPKAIMVLECSSVTKEVAKVPAHISLQSLKAGMVFRLVKDRKPVMASTRSIERIDQKEAGESTITFIVAKASPAGRQAASGNAPVSLSKHGC